MTRKHILDNTSDRNKVSDYLRRHLPDSDAFRLVSAYFSIYGYEVLMNELNELTDIKFLFGNPESIGELDPVSKDEKTFEFTEDGLSLNKILQQRPLARSCEKWVAKDSVQIRSIKQKNVLHGKMYLAEKQDQCHAVIGSSNFTKRGLGGSNQSNVEINLATNDNSICNELREWFDQLWQNQKKTEDIKDKVLAALRRYGKDYDPELIYYKTLYEMFYDEIERRKIGDDLTDTNLFDTKIWEDLYDFQKEGAKSVISRLKQLNGCILADSVGLGKTYTALAVIKYFELQNERVLVLCPKRLRENWAVYPSANNQFNNPFIDDRFDYALLSHTDLTRTNGLVGNIDLANFNWGNFQLIVIDESHNFRNASQSSDDQEGNIRHSRYSSLLEQVIKSGPKTKVLMLSATPVNTSLNDLKSQIMLATEGRSDVFKTQLGVGNIAGLISQAENKFKDWEKGHPDPKKRDKDILIEELGSDFFQLLAGVSIARSRRHLREYYKDELEKIGPFPEVIDPENKFPKTDRLDSLSFVELAEKIDQFSLSIYQPSKYLLPKYLQDQAAQLARESSLLGMMRTNFFKRLESSAWSLNQTLNRTINKIDVLLEKIDSYENREAPPESLEYLTPDEEDVDENYYVNKKIQNPYHLSQLDLTNWKCDLQKDKTILCDVQKQVEVITPDRDGKLIELKGIIKNKKANPSFNQYGKPNRKLLIFTTFKDTAEYLYEKLEGLHKELKINMALVSGDLTRTTIGDNRFNTILTNFSPHSKGRNENNVNNDIDLLIATDCISEGQNLQDCDMVINYDIHWNPVRVIQRFGRINRIGSLNKSIKMINFWPIEDMEKYLNLVNRVEARMALAINIGAGPDVPSSTDTFRDKQLKELRETVIDIDNDLENVSMSDFTLDDFFVQLIKFLEKNKEKLEKIPLGVYSITEAECNTHKGIIFVLRQRQSENSKAETTASPIHPYYAVHINYQGDIRISCTNPKKILELFQHNTAGQDKPLQNYCDKFDEETKQGRDMSEYENLLKRVVDHIGSKNLKRSARELVFNDDFILPVVEANDQKNNFDLITWLMIK